jgi:predicted ATPase/DNA-binding winged helix-turn-helix (wHTH) protein
MTSPIEIRFGEFRLFPREQLLMRGDTALNVTARAYALLLALVEGAGGLVTKDALLQRVWAGLVVEDNNLAVQIGVLRKILGADAIATVPGRGYRFGLAVRTLHPTAPAAAARGNVPAAVSALIGREVDLAAVQACLEAHRLTTVVGAGGIGKSRLALAAAGASRDGWRDGAWWIELAGLSDAALLVTSVAQTLGIALPDRETGPAALASALADRELLLVIDNCEHLLDGVAGLVDRLLKVAPGLRVLATSQEPLRLDAEQQYRLDPLAVPTDAATPDAREYAALALLISRVQATQSGYALTDHDLPLAIELCRRLDGLPLAIELAAARVPLLGLRTVHDHLDERFRLLTAGSRTAMRRHQTLRAAIDWSHALLDDAQRAVFMRLGVFSGGFTLRLAQRLCADAQLDEWSVLDQVAALVEKSLVVLDRRHAEPRYRLLESTRAYALEQLAGSLQTASCLQRHARTLLDFLRRVDDANMAGELRTDEYAAQVLPELDNLRAAQAWATGLKGDRDVAVGLAAHVSPLIDYSLEFVDWMLDQRSVVAAAAVDKDTAARFWRGLAASNMAGYVTMTEQLEAAQRAAAMYHGLDRPKHRFSALRRVSVWAVWLGDDALAERAVKESEELIQPDWGTEFRIEVLRGRSILAARQGDLDQAIALRQEAARVARDEADDWRLQIIDETIVADLLWRAKRPGDAAELLARLIEGMRLRPASDYELLDVLETRLWILSDRGDLPGATALARQALPVMRRMPRFALIGCAHLLMRLGHFGPAARVLGAQSARTRRGLEQPTPPGFSVLARLHSEALAAVEAALRPEDLGLLLRAGEGLAYSDVCDLLAMAIAVSENVKA